MLTTAVLAQKPDDLGKTFLNFFTQVHEVQQTPLDVSVAPDSSANYVSDSGLSEALTLFLVDFRNSLCVLISGKRKALLVGINYFGSSKELKGCIEDTTNIRKLITTVYGFPDNDAAITVLTDDQTNSYLQPTRKNIIAVSLNTETLNTMDYRH